MVYPNVWGQGSLFAFSGLEGRTCWKDQLVGSLLGDQVGIRFNSAYPFSLYVDTAGTRGLQWNAVTSDWIDGTLLMNGEQLPISFVFVKNATVVGRCPAGRVRLSFNGMTSDPSIRLTQRDEDGGTYFCLSAEGETDCGADMVEESLRRAKAFYDALDCPVGMSDKKYGWREMTSEDLRRTYAKAVSIMKSSVYAPEGRFKQLWTTPDRYPHKRLWLWDSCFHSFGNICIGEKLAWDSVLSVLDTQGEDGFIPHMAGPDDNSNITQPPVIAWAVEKLLQKTGDSEKAALCYGKLCAYLEWNKRNRTTETGLFYWFIHRDSVTCRCGESGMDNCSRFDDVEEMECIDFSCFMVREAQAMKTLADALGMGEDAAAWERYADTLGKTINERLWDEKEGYYYDYELKTMSLHKVKSVASFLPLFVGICPKERIGRLINALYDPKQFLTRFAFSGISKEDPTYGTDMWRGPVWINYMYMLADGLRRAGFAEKADKLIVDVVSELAFWYRCEGVLYEFYDCRGLYSPSRLDRKGPPIHPYIIGGIGQSIRDYGWTASLYAALIQENPGLFA